MIRHAISLTLICVGIAGAQQPSTQVQDLLTGEATHSRAERARLVRRVTSRDWPAAPRVTGEGYLLRPTVDDEPFLRPRPYFTERLLLDLVRVLRPEADNGLELLRFGERIELRSRAPELLQAALADLRAALPPRVRCTLRLERQIGEVITVLLQGDQEYANGETLVIADVEQTAQVLDVEVEIAQASMLGNPVKFPVTYGTSAILRARPLPGTEQAVVECVLRHAAPFREKAMPRSSTIGPFDRHATSVAEAGLVFRITNGTETRHEWQDYDGSTLRLVCGASWQPRQESAALSITPLLNEPVLGFRSSRRSEPEDPQEMLPVGQMVQSQLEARDDGGSGGAQWLGQGGSNLLLLDDSGAQRQVRSIYAGIAAAMRPVNTTLEVVSVPAGAEVRALGELPARSQVLWRTTGPGVVGLPSCFSSGRQRSYVRDWDVEVAQAARIADPKVSMFEDGWFATVKALPSVPGGGRRVELSLQHVDFIELDRVALVVGEEVNASTDSQKVVLPREELSIEKPVTRAVEFASTVSLDQQGSAVVRRAAARTLGEGRELVIRIIVE